MPPDRRSRISISSTNPVGARWPSWTSCPAENLPVVTLITDVSARASSYRRETHQSAEIGVTVLERQQRPARAVSTDTIRARMADALALLGLGVAVLCRRYRPAARHAEPIAIRQPVMWGFDASCETRNLPGD
jgi:hypothetical protein